MKTRSKLVAETARWREDDDWPCEKGGAIVGSRRQYGPDGLKWVVMNPSQGSGGTAIRGGGGLACMENLILMHCAALPSLDKQYIRQNVVESMNLLGRHKDHGLLVGITFKVYGTAYCELTMMSVNMSHQCCGYGRKAIARLKEYLVHQLGVRTIVVWADYTATGFYTKVGFRDEVTLPARDYRYELHFYTKSRLMQCDLDNERLCGNQSTSWVMDVDGVARQPKGNSHPLTQRPADWAAILTPKRGGLQRKEILQVTKVVNRLKTLNASFYFLGHDDYTRARTVQQPFKRRIELPINIEYIEQRLKWDRERRRPYSAVKFVRHMERLFVDISEGHLAKNECLQNARQMLEEEFRKLCCEHLSKFVKLKRKK